MNLRRKTPLNLSLLTLLLATGCASGVCRVDMTDASERRIARTDVTRITPATWAQLLLRGSNYTCTGARLPQPQPGSGAGESDYRTIVSAHAAGEGRHLVWLIVQRRGMKWAGPLALVERHGDALVARSVGTLELPGGEISLRYNYGAHRETVWAASKLCRPARALSRPVCHEQVAIFGRSGDALVALSEPITTHRERISAVGNGWHHVTLERCTISERADRLVLAQRNDEHEIQAHRRNALPRQRRSQTQNFELLLKD